MLDFRVLSANRVESAQKVVVATPVLVLLEDGLVNSLTSGTYLLVKA